MIEKGKNKLFVLSGASGSGKSSLLKRIVDENLCEQAPKYSNREKRIVEFDDIIHNDIDSLREKCDILYERYDTWYGINTIEIKEKLKHTNLIVIISDIASIKDLKNNLSEETLIVFIYLQDLCIDNLLKERYKLWLKDVVRKEFANYILDCRKTANENWLKDAPENINNTIEKIKNNFSNEKIYQEFIKRCNSWIELEIEYKKNKNLFTNTISGRTIEELFYRFRCQFFED